MARWFGRKATRVGRGGGGGGGGWKWLPVLVGVQTRGEGKRWKFVDGGLEEREEEMAEEEEE